MVSGARAVDRHGHHQRRHRDRRRRRSAAHRRDRPLRRLAVGVHHVRRGRPAVDCLVVRLVSNARGPSRPVGRGAVTHQRRRRGHTERGRNAHSLALATPPARGVGTGGGKVPHRRRLVLLSLLAAEVSLRCARLRREAGRLLRVDSLCRCRHREPDRRLVLELAADARAGASTSRARPRSAPAPQ